MCHRYGGKPFKTRHFDDVFPPVVIHWETQPICPPPSPALTAVAALERTKTPSDPPNPDGSHLVQMLLFRLHRHSWRGSSLCPITPRFLRLEPPQRFWHLDPIGDQTRGHERGLGEELLITSVCSCLGLLPSLTPPLVGCLFWLLPVSSNKSAATRSLFFFK